MQAIKDQLDKIDWTMVLSFLVATGLLGAIVYGLQKANMNKLAKIMKAGG